MLFVTLLAIMIIWMARQVLRPAEELEASRGRLQDLYELARVDSLRDVTTGLGNHRAFQEAFERQVDAARTRQASVGLVLIDLDDFRAVNDSGGHAAGDEVLAAFGRLVQATLRPSDRAFRTGGDEFALLLPGATIESAAAVARRLLATSMEVRPGRGEPAPRSFSAGVSAFPAMANDRRQLLDQADTALTWAKRHGRTSVESFDPARHRQAGPASDAPAIEQTAVGVAEVIARRLLRPVYQPIVDLQDRPGGRVRGPHPADAGLRLRQPGRAVHRRRAGRSDGRARLRLSRDRRRRRGRDGRRVDPHRSTSRHGRSRPTTSAPARSSPSSGGPASIRPGSSSS